jgi:uncharacterized lipoprotein YehR (DUF1307 family)
MKKMKKILVLLLVAAIVSFGLMGCKEKSEHPTAEQPTKGTESKETESGEHPAGEHPAGEHPE